LREGLVLSPFFISFSLHIFPTVAEVMNPFTMRSNRLNLITTALACFVFMACNKTTEQFTNEPLSSYLPLQVGKYITYRLDSTVFTSFGTVTEIHSYQEKDTIDAKITDGLGRDSYRILRFLRDTAATKQWSPAGTFFITPTDKTIEVIDNNLRILKLVAPIKQDNTWKGNRYLPDEAYSSMYSFNNDFEMQDWDYTYSSVNESLSLNGKAYNNVMTVDGIDEVFNANASTTTVIDKNSIAYVNHLQDKYSKNLGLIYQEFIMWEYQPPNGINQAGSKVGFGVRRSIIDHN